MVKDEIALELVNYWIANYPNHLREIPENLKGKISLEEAMNLQKPYRIKGHISLESLGKLRKELRDRIAIKRSSIKKEKWSPTKIQVVTSIILCVIAILGFLNYHSINDFLKTQNSLGIKKILPSYDNLLFSSKGKYDSTYESNFKLGLEVWADPSINAQITIRQTGFSIDKSAYNYLDKSIYGERLPYLSIDDISIRINEENDSMTEQHIKKSFDIPSEVNNLWLKPDVTTSPTKFKLGEVNLTITLLDFGMMKSTGRNITVPVYWENK